MLIEDHWLRPPAETNEAKKVRELEKRLAAYEAQESKIVIEHDGGETVAVVRRIARALSEVEVEELMGVLKAKHPMATDFTPPPVPGVQLGRAEIPPDYTLEPPDEAAIRRYHDETYPRWLDRCREILSKLHEGRDVPEAPVHLLWRLRNEGSRPATRIRVEFEAQGPLTLMLPSNEDERGDEEADAQEHQPSRPMLTRPPAPPAFRCVPSVATSNNDSRRKGVDLATLGAAGLSRSALADLAPALSAAEAMRRSFGTSGVSGLFNQVESATGAARLFEDHRRMLGLVRGGKGCRARPSGRRFPSRSSPSHLGCLCPRSTTRKASITTNGAPGRLSDMARLPATCGATRARKGPSRCRLCLKRRAPQGARSAAPSMRTT